MPTSVAEERQLDYVELDVPSVKLGIQGTLAMPSADPFEAKKLVEELLSEDVAKHHCFIHCEARFHSHVAHHMLAAYDMGASADLLKAIYSEEEEQTLPLLSRTSTAGLADYHEITEDNWTQHLGDFTYYVHYLVFFSKAIRRLGMRTTLERYLLDNSEEGGSDMLWRLVSGIFHPLILLGYAIEFESEAILAQALAQTAVHDLWGPDSTRDVISAQSNDVATESSFNLPNSIFAIFQEVCESKELEPVLPYYSFEIMHPEDESPDAPPTSMRVIPPSSQPSPMPSPTLSDTRTADSDASSPPDTPSDAVVSQIDLPTSFKSPAALEDLHHILGLYPRPISTPDLLRPHISALASRTRFKRHRPITVQHRDALFNKRLFDACEGGTRPAAIHRICRKWWTHLDQTASLLEHAIDEKIRDLTIISILLLTSIPVPPSQPTTLNAREKHKLDFFLMHILNATHFLPRMHAFLGSRATEKVLRALLPTVMMMVLLRGRPKVDARVVMGYDSMTGLAGAGWTKILEEATHARDPHVLKSVRTMYAAARRYGCTLDDRSVPKFSHGIESALVQTQPEVDSTLFTRAATMILDVMGWLTRGDEAGRWDRCGLGWEEAWDVVDDE